MSEPTSEQFSLFKDSIARRLLDQSGINHSSSESSDLDDFSSYLASESWPSLPQSVREATYESRSKVPDSETISLHSTSISFDDTLISYGLVADTDDAHKFLRKSLADYIEQACAPPPVWKSTRATECEICERTVPLTYHHLIPRSTHTKVLKKGWHPDYMLNSVAWLCRWVTLFWLSYVYYWTLG